MATGHISRPPWAGVQCVELLDGSLWYEGITVARRLGYNAPSIVLKAKLPKKPGLLWQHQSTLTQHTEGMDSQEFPKTNGRTIWLSAAGLVALVFRTDAHDYRVEDPRRLFMREVMPGLLAKATQHAATMFNGQVPHAVADDGTVWHRAINVGSMLGYKTPRKLIASRLVNHSNLPFQGMWVLQKDLPPGCQQARGPCDSTVWVTTLGALWLLFKAGYEYAEQLDDYLESPGARQVFYGMQIDSSLLDTWQQTPSVRRVRQ